MAQQFANFTDQERPCAYLPGETSRMEILGLIGIEEEELDYLLERGWRHFGATWFRPKCKSCTECRNVRVMCEDFVPSKSQNRALKKVLKMMTFKVDAPRYSKARVDLHKKWYDWRQEGKPWQKSNIDQKNYMEQFVNNEDFAQEMSWYIDDKLVAISLFDQGIDSLNAIYFFYDPEIMNYSPGKANVVLLWNYCIEQGIPYLYLGFDVKGCDSLNYKSNFKPQEELKENISFSETPTWTQRE